MPDIDPREQKPAFSSETSTGEGIMENMVSRFGELRERPVSLMFIDSILKGHERLNYAVIGDTASENPSFSPSITAPHGFQVGMFTCTAGNGPAYHRHDYIEAFMPLTDHKWRFYYGPDAETVEGEIFLEKWDLISFPPNVWRGFEVAEGEEGEALALGILEEHKVFTGKDPYWSPYVTKAAEKAGFHADETGKMMKPDNYSELEKDMLDKLGANDGTELK